MTRLFDKLGICSYAAWSVLAGYAVSPALFFFGVSPCYLFLIVLLVICSYAGTFSFSFFHLLELKGQPTRRLFVLTWLGLPGYIHLYSA